MKEKAEILMSIFSGLTRAHGIYEITGKQKNTAKGIKKEGRGKTLHQPVTTELWQKHIAGEVSIGIIPLTDDEKCSWGCIDVDEYPINTKQIIKTISEMQAPCTLHDKIRRGASVYVY